MNTLLVLTDFTPAADNALHYATGLAASLQAHLLLLHVQPGLLSPDAFTGKYPSRSESELQALLDERCARAETSGVACASELASGSVGDTVAKAARRHHALLAIAGKPNTQETQDELVDSASLDLVRDTPCPVLVVPESYASAQLPARLLLATDLSDIDFGNSVVNANALLRHWQPAVTVAYVADADNPNELAVGATHLAPLLRDVSQVQVQHFRHSDAEEGLLAAAQSVQADWLLLVARQRSRLSLMFNNSVTAKVLLHSPVPVLVVAEA
ncbi:universal stress protein [Hymenobacter sp. B1770]|uniref:universal stress protein n=1 Tax=Hymenobacter sp. B1770 TaxID=1718788 RepID=UPI003CE88E33